MKLIKPIKAHGEMLAELTFREPTGADIARNGFPFKYEQNGGTTSRLLDAAAISKMIADLAGIPTSSVGQLCALDFTRAMGEVVGFFADMEIPGTS